MLPEMILQHTVQVEPYLGSGAFGDTWGPAFPVPCLVDAKRRLVRDRGGSQVVSETTILADRGPTIPDRSRITLPDGSQTLVIAVRDHDGGDLPVPSHLEIVCE